MHKKFEINWTQIKGGCQSGRKVVPHDSESDLPIMSAKLKIMRNRLQLGISDQVWSLCLCV